MTASSGQQALANGRQLGSGMSGMCQAYVRDPCWRVPALYGSAWEAWQGAEQKHPGDRTPPVGAPCYYKGGNYGHAVISAGGGKVRSTDCTTTSDISEVDVGWFEAHWGYSYLGWTGDINAVDLPLGGDAGEDEDMELADKMDEWSPADGTSKEQVTVGYTLRQARGYAEDGYQRVGKLQQQVEQLQESVDRIIEMLG